MRTPVVRRSLSHVRDAALRVLCGKALTHQPIAAATGILGGIALGIVLGDGDVTAAVAMPVAGVAVLAIAHVLVPATERATFGKLVLLGFALHAAVLTLLHAGSVAIGLGGFITGDDADYARLSWYVAQYLHGQPQPPYVPPDWAGEDYIIGTWVYLEAALFYVFGPHVLLAKIVNAALMMAVVVLVYDMARRMFGTKAALTSATLVAFYPSLVLWSSLNLKDALGLLLASLVFWLLLRFQQRPRWWALVAAYAVIVPMADLRGYVFFWLTIVVPVAVLLAPASRLGGRLLSTGAAAALSAVLLVTTQSGLSLLGPQLLTAFEVSRQAMAVGARTGFLDPPPMIVYEGTTLVIATTVPLTASQGTSFTVPGPAPATAQPTAVQVEPSSPPQPTPTPTIVYVPPNTRIVVLPPGVPKPTTQQGTVSAASGAPIMSAAATATPPAKPTPTPASPPTPTPAEATPAAPTQSPRADVVYVHPGDIVVVGPPGSPVQPSPDRLTVTRGSVQLMDPETATDSGARAARTLDHLPKGIAYALFAPFPWELRRTLDLLTVPEMLAWYVVLAAAVWATLRARHRWPLIAPIALFVGGVVLTLALAEGNVGTLFRHRAMVIPYVILLASPGLLELARRLRPLAVRATAFSRTGVTN